MMREPLRQTSKQRVLTAVNLGEPDRVPIDVLPNPWVTQRLHHDLGTRTHRQLLERLHCDVVDLRGVVDPKYCGPVPPSRELQDGVRENFWGWRQKVTQSATGPEDCFVEFVLSDADSIDDLTRHRWPSPDWFDFSDVAERLADWQDLAVMASGASVFQHPSFLRGIDQLLMDMALRPEMAHWLMDRFTDFYLVFFDRMFTAAKGQIDILRAADDLGTQRGLFFSPEMFRTFLKPRLKKLVDMAHSHDVKFLFHSCGAIRPVIEDLIQIGVDILDPLQAAAEGMDPSVLKDAYGDRICLHGGICTQYLLPNGTPDEVRREVRRRVDILGRGGGYILAPCHVLQTDVPTENILAMTEAWNLPD
jgi:uroporphyrinogen decarboxylase